MLRLSNEVQHYAWGSTTHLPELLGREADGRPYAELWMGAHPAAPSLVRAADGLPGRPLTALLAAEPDATLGPQILATFGSRLPYLFKVLAVGRPLSLQVHPDPARARAGFAREEESGIPVDAPERCFKDDQHKPELVVALTRFEALSGFRRPERVRELLEGLDVPLAARLIAMLRRPDGLREAFSSLLDPQDGLADDVALLARACARRLATGSPSPRADGTVVALAQWYPGDPGAVASLFLNRVTLEPGEAMYVPAGSVHAYLDGCALEIMACSDNVLRAGLTSKHIDVTALLECTEYTSGPPARPEAEAHGPTRVYRAPTPEFALAVTGLAEAGETVVDLAPLGPRVVLCLEGEVELVTREARVVVRRGEAVLVTDDDGAVQVRGVGRVATAFVPIADPSDPAPGVPDPGTASTTPADPVNTSLR